MSGEQSPDINMPLFAWGFKRFAAVADRRGQAEHRRELLAPLSGRVIELGAGSGRNFPHYPSAVDEVVAVEPEPRLRREAERVAAPVPIRVLPGVADALPAEEASFDAAVASLVLCSVPDPDRALAELRRVLRSGGRLLVTTPCHGRVRDVAIALARFEAHFDPLGQHLRFYTRRSLRATLAAFAFDDVRLWTFGGPPLLRRALVARALRGSLLRAPG